MRPREIQRFASQTRKSIREVEALRQEAEAIEDPQERNLIEVRIETLERATKEWSDIAIELSR